MPSMKLLFAKSNWEAGDMSLPMFLERVASAGFDATEIYLPNVSESPADVIRWHERTGLKLIGQIATDGSSVNDHVAALERGYRKALECGAMAVNSHTGRDIFSRDDNLEIYRAGQALVEKHGLPLWHETHRRRALFCGPAAAAYLRELPALAITADFSHWFCVHESDLSDQNENVAAAIAATRHIHARVGFPEGPQVSDPRNPGCAVWLDRHVELWRRIVVARVAEGCEWLAITPEFGPVPYMPLAGIENRGVADPWAINCWMRDYLRKGIASSPA